MPVLLFRTIFLPRPDFQLHNGSAVRLTAGQRMIRLPKANQVVNFSTSHGLAATIDNYCFVSSSTQRLYLFFRSSNLPSIRKGGRLLWSIKMKCEEGSTHSVSCC